MRSLFWLGISIQKCLLDFPITEWVSERGFFTSFPENDRRRSKIRYQLHKEDFQERICINVNCEYLL